MPISYFDSYAPMQSYTWNVAQDAGKRIYFDMQNGRANRYVQLYILATITIAGVPATSIKSNGYVEALFTEMGINEAGTDIIVGDPRGLMFSAEFMLRQSASTRVRLTSVAVGAYNLTSMWRIWFENPQSVNPRETLFLEKSLNQKLRFFATLGTDVTGAGGSSLSSGRILVAPGGCTVTVAVEIRPQQLADAGAGSLPLFRPKVDRIDFPVAVVSQYFRCDIPLDSNQYLRGLTIIQDSGAGLDQTIAQQILLRGDRFEYIGEGQQIGMDPYGRSQEFESGGDVFSTSGFALVHINLQKSGRLSRCFNPAQDTNLRLIMQTSAIPAGATLIVLRHMLVRDLYVGSDGRRIVAPDLPEDLKAA